MAERIEDNESFKKLKTDIKNLETLGKFLTFFRLPGADTWRQSRTRFNELKEELKKMSERPDTFNHHFAEDGWIAYETMNTEIMDTAIDFADQGKRDEAEQVLLDYYCPENINKRLFQLKRIKEFTIRLKFIRLAAEDYGAERYHACVPILLMMIDGIVSDIENNRGFFTENSNLRAWDSIAAHSTGLTAVKAILNKNRIGTREETITLPYRNGILHGRDLGYDNKIVAAKCWATLFALCDWAQALKDGKKEKPPEEPEPTLIESYTLLKDVVEKHQEIKGVHKKIDEWEPRVIKIGIDCKPNGLPEEYGELTPEREVSLFFDHWKMKRYGLIAQRINHASHEPSIGKEAGRIKLLLEDKHLIDYHITEIKDCAPAISEVYVDVNIEYDGQVYLKKLKFRCCYKGKKNEILIFGDPGGTWKYFDLFLYDISACYIKK